MKVRFCPQQVCCYIPRYVFPLLPLSLRKTLFRHAESIDFTHDGYRFRYARRAWTVVEICLKYRYPRRFPLITHA